MFQKTMRALVVLLALPLLLTACKGAAGTGSGDPTAITGRLASLSISAGTLTPAFDKDITHYSVDVPYSVTSVNITTALDETSSLTVNGGVHTSSNVHTIHLAVGTQTVSLVVTYGTITNPQTLTYRIAITRGEMATNVNLSGLTPDSGTLSPAFAANTISYTVSVPYSVSAIGFTPTAADANALLTVNGASVTSGHASGAIALSVGSNTVTVVSSNGATGSELQTKTYTVTVTRTAPSNNANLSGLTLSSGSLSPAFSSSTLAYSANVSYTTDAITVTATKQNPQAGITVEGSYETSGQPSASIPLSIGSNTVTVVVTSESGTTTKSYVITVTRSGPSNNANLSLLSVSSGSLSPVFAMSTTSYTVNVPYVVDTFQFTPTVAVSVSTLTINGSSELSGQASSAFPLIEGANAFTIVVTAEDTTTTKTYDVTVNRAAASSENHLSGLTVSPGLLTPSFSANTLSYTVLISDQATNFTFTPTAADSTSLIEYQWNTGSFDPATTAVASTQLFPNAGDNVLTIRMTSQSGAVLTYSLTVVYDICGAGYYDNGTHSCMPVGVGYYSPDADDNRFACNNKPSNAHYTSPTADTISCPWSCDTSYLTTDGVTCSSYPNATILSCNSDEVVVGMYGRYGSIIDRIGVRCATIVNGIVSSTHRDGPSYGGSGGGAFSEDCASDSVGFEVDGDLSSFIGATRTGRLRHRCFNTASENLTGWSPTAGSYWGASTGMGSFNFQCGSGANPFGQYMNGLIIDNAGGASYVGPILGITCR